MQDRIKYLMIFYRSTLKLAIGTGLLVAVWLCLTAPAAIPGTFFLCFPTIGLAMDAFYRFLSKKGAMNFTFTAMPDLALLNCTGSHLPFLQQYHLYP